MAAREPGVWCSEIKVRGYHLDVYGHVNNARYLEFLEEARWAAFDDGKLDLRDWERRGRAFFVVNINISYRAPASLGDLLRVCTRIERFGDRSATLRQLVVRVGDGVTVADAAVTFVIFDRAAGRALPLEGELREAIERVLGDERP
jgi:thioesterase III